MSTEEEWGRRGEGRLEEGGGRRKGGGGGGGDKDRG